MVTIKKIEKIYKESEKEIKACHYKKINKTHKTAIKEKRDKKATRHVYSIILYTICNLCFLPTRHYAFMTFPHKSNSFISNVS